METVNIHEAKTNFSRLIARVEAGEQIVVARDGTPVARIVAFRPARTKRLAGRDRGLFTVPDDFDAALPPDALADFE